ncbi:MAG TPA: nucleotide exchange factor GrpE [Candidatus Angelobacter sp.]
MSKSNGQSDIGIEEQSQQNPEPELPPADLRDGFEEKATGAQAGQEPPATPAAEPAKATEDLNKLRAERDNLLDRLARLQAEFDNARKRAARENAEFRDYAVTDAVRVLLPVTDSLSLALKNADANPQEFKKGVELIQKQLQEALQKIGVQRVPAQGQPFDPRWHEAIEMVESNDVQDNHVIEELQPGYKIKERLLRPAMVRVAKNNKSSS